MAITKLNSLAIPPNTIVESDLSYPLTNFSSTGIDDNATSTAITIDASENVGIGTTSPSQLLNVAGNADVNGDFYVGSSNNIIYESGTTFNVRAAVADLTFQTNGGNERMRIDSSGNLNVDRGQSLRWYDGTIGSGNINAAIEGTGEPALKLYTRQSGTSTLTERMRIDSSGNVGIGTTSPFSTARLQVKTGTNLNLAVQTGTTETSGMKINAFNDAGSANIPLELNGSVTLLKTGETERMRIDSSGNVLVGVTSSSIKLHVLDSTADAVALFQNTSSATSGVGGIYSSIPSTANNTNCYHFKGTTQGVASYYLYGNGTSSFTSDERQKKNIVNTRDGYLDDLKRLRVVDYHWNNQEDTEDKSVGLIAQEVEQVFPHLVIEHEMEGVGPRKNLRGSEFTFVLIKAIQEQQAMIEELKAEVAASKGA